MCTVSWIRADGALVLLASRDERRGRAPERPPYVDAARGVRFVAPRDGDFGGTWIAASERGLVLALLNGHREPEHDAAPPPGGESRGRLVLELADAADPAEVAARLAESDLTRFRSFALLAAQPDARAVHARWSGAALELDEDAEDEMPLVSSAFDADGTARRRRALLARLAGAARPDAALLRRFHASHDDGPGPYSPCMHRADACTRSLTELHVEPRRVRIAHHAGAPCEPAARTALELARATAHAKR